MNIRSITDAEVTISRETYDALVSLASRRVSGGTPIGIAFEGQARRLAHILILLTETDLTSPALVEGN